MLVSEQDRIIGPHTNLTSALKDWLSCRDLTVMPAKKIRHLDENSNYRNALLDECAWWLVIRHVGKMTWDYLEEERKTQTFASYKILVDTGRYLPIDDKTKKGNLGEILLSKYIEEVTGYTTFDIFRLNYSTNVDQSMKGDDVLLFHPSNVYTDVIYGESKVRKAPSKKVVKEIVNNLQGNKRLPVSITFVSKRLRESGNAVLAKEIDKMHVELTKGNVPVRNVGMLMSKRVATPPSKDTLSTVVRHLNTTNSNLAFIALGIDRVQEFVNEAYQKAYNILLTGKP